MISSAISALAVGTLSHSFWRRCIVGYCEEVYTSSGVIHVHFDKTATLAVFIYPAVIILCIASVLWGGVIYQTEFFESIMLTHIDNQFMGRVNTGLNSIKLLMQSLLIFIITRPFLSAMMKLYMDI